MTAARRISLIIIAWWRRLPRLQPPTARPLPARVPFFAPRHKGIPEAGRFYFRGAILDQLDLYFGYLARLRVVDEQDYNLFGQIGAAIMPGASIVAIAHDLPPSWRAGKRPFAGGVAYGLKPGEEKCEHSVPLRFLFWRRVNKITPLVAAAKPGWTVYNCSGCWADPPGVKGRREDSTMEFYVAVSPDGTEIELLKQRGIERQSVRCKTGPGWHNIPVRCWTWPWIVHGLTDPELCKPEAIPAIFCQCVHAFENSNADIRVAVSKGDLVGAFSVDLLRTPYFFSDRDREPGTHKRIFHIVRAHRRVSWRGDSVVHTHFRGERDFTWHGYRVVITMPGLHHRPLAEFETGGWEFGKFAPMPKGWLETPEFAKRVRAATTDLNKRSMREWRRRFSNSDA